MYDLDTDWRAARAQLRELYQDRKQAGLRYRDDPVGWVQHRAQETLWSKQREVVTSVVNNRRTAVKSCHGVGKSFTASRTAAWFIDAHPPGEAFVVTTAPTGAQVHAIIWRELRRLHLRAQLIGRITGASEWKLDDGELVAFGRKPGDYDPGAFQGIHAPQVLVILDEATYIPPQLWEAAESLTSNRASRVLAIGNPDDPGSEFFRVCAPGSGWNVITISAFDSPNFTDEKDELTPFVLDQLVSPEYAEERLKKWGRDHPYYQSKVLGEFPTTNLHGLIQPPWITKAYQLWEDLDGYDEASWANREPRILGVDVARYGTDKTIFVRRCGELVQVVAELAQSSTPETSGHVAMYVRQYGLDEAHVDGVGVGGGVVDELHEDAVIEAADMQGGARARDSARFENARAEWYWGLRDALEEGRIALDPRDEDLAGQLLAIRWKTSRSGKVMIESKDDMRRRGVASPDRADAVVYAVGNEPETNFDDLYGVKTCECGEVVVVTSMTGPRGCPRCGKVIKP